MALHLSVFSGRSETIVKTSGFLNETMFNGGSPLPQESSSNEFSATISSDGRYILEVRPIHRKDDPMYGKMDAIYLTFDGSDTYFCQYSEAVRGITNGEPGLIGTQAITNQPQTAYISAGNYPFSPFESQRRAQVLWLIFGAGEYMRASQVETMPLPWVPARLNLVAYGFRYEKVLSSSPPYIPIQIKFIRDSKQDLENEGAEQQRPELDKAGDMAWVEGWGEQVKQRKMVSQGTVIGTLETKNFTNQDGLEIPLNFTVKTFLPDGGLRRLYVGAITNINRLTHSESFQPPIVAGLAMFDTRLRYRDASKQIDYVNYRLNVGENWLATNSAYLKALQKAYLALPKLSAKHPLLAGMSISTIRFILLCAFVLISVIFLFILIPKQKNRNN